MPRKVDTVGKCFAGNTKSCLLCGYMVSSDTGIKLHLKMKHNINNSGANICKCCFACGKDFENYGKLLKHLKKDHY